MSLDGPPSGGSRPCPPSVSKASFTDASRATPVEVFSCRFRRLAVRECAEDLDIFTVICGRAKDVPGAGARTIRSGGLPGQLPGGAAAPCRSQVHRTGDRIRVRSGIQSLADVVVQSRLGPVHVAPAHLQCRRSSPNPLQCRLHLSGLGPVGDAEFGNISHPLFVGAPASNCRFSRFGATMPCPPW